MKKAIVLFIACSLLTSCIAVKAKDVAPGKPGISAVKAGDRK
ncbi:hypothetical protein [uncultured Chryseobacterium sp.]|nr:hypothetical protein [uncultured Chryseobacterium sp.]